MISCWASTQPSLVGVQDCHAMGARARTALAVAVVPFGPEAKVEAELAQTLAGACRVLGAAGCALVGGHSSEGPELALGACWGSGL